MRHEASGRLIPWVAVVVTALLLTTCGEDTDTPPNGETASSHTHAAGPHGGYLLALGDHAVHLEIVHNEHWGLVALYVFDADMEPREFDAAPVLCVMLDGDPVRLTGSHEDWDGNEDGGWHFEDDALLGEPEGGRFRLLLDGETYTPEFRHIHVGHIEEG